MKKAVDKFSELARAVSLGGAPKEDPAVALRDQARDEAFVKAARRRLADAGLPKDRVEKFPALQVVLLDEKLAFEVYRDDAIKWTSLPYWQAEGSLAGQDKVPEKRPLAALLFAYTLPSKVRNAQARLDQRLALLRHVEAVRLHAAANGGKVPARLADIKVPLPEDPITGKPFRYKVEGNTAMIQGTPPKGFEDNPAYNIRYEVTIK
jgi:hypothetical protein